jgi:hypothetical protein
VDPWITQGVLACVIAVLWYLLRQKDSKQEKDFDEFKKKHEEDIKLLWEKHEQDANALVQVQLQLAGNHYQRDELDRRFDKLEHAIKSGFEFLGREIKGLTNSLLSHIAKEDGNS